MHDKSDHAELCDKILGHPVVEAMDRDEQHALAKEIAHLKLPELDKKIRRLDDEYAG